MKQILNSLALLILIIATHVQPLHSAVGDTWQSGGIFYRVLEEGSSLSKCEIIPAQGTSQYKGDIEIPPTVTNGNISYTVTRIGDSAFYNTKITSIVLPGSLQEIGDKAFYGASLLKTFSFPESPMLQKIGEDVFSVTFLETVKISQFTGNVFDPSILFSGFNDLKQFEISGTNKYWDVIDGVLYKKLANSKLELSIYPASKEGNSFNFPEKCTSIGQIAFEDNKFIEEISIPDHITLLSPYSFSNMKSLKKLTIGNGVTDIPKNCFFGIGNPGATMSIKFGANIQTIGESAFEFTAFGPFASVELPEGIKKIGKFAFAFSTMREINLPSSLEEIEEQAFKNTFDLAKITIPANVKLGNQIFYNCGSLMTVNIQEGVKEIPYAMFLGCPFYNINIPASVEVIGSKAFQQCTQLRKITVDPANNHFMAVDNVLFTKDKTELLVFPAQNIGVKSYTVPEGVKRIATAAFACTSELTEVSLPASIDSISPLAFGRGLKLKTVSFPANSPIRYISESTFDGCEALEALILPDGIIEIKDYALQACWNLNNFEFPKKLKRIGTGAFKNALNFQEITFPPELESIGANAFESARLKGVLIIPSTLTNWGRESFYCMGQVDEIFVDSKIPIPSSAFARVMMPKKVTVTKNVPKAEDGAFGMVHPYGVIEEVILEEGGLKYIGVTAFCGKFESIKVPDSVEYMDGQAFSSPQLKSIELGTGLKTIGIINTIASDLTSIVCNAKTPPAVIPDYDSYGGLVLEETYQKATLFVPEESIDDYKQAPYWNRFVNIKSLDMIGVESVVSDADNVVVTVNGHEINVEGTAGNISVTGMDGQTVYSGPATAVSVAQSGVYIIRAAGRSFKIMVK